jgi:hypothetical protein
MPIERILEIFGNRYLALNIASLEVRRIIAAIDRGEIEIKGSAYYQALRRLVDGDLQYEAKGKEAPLQQSG